MSNDTCTHFFNVHTIIYAQSFLAYTHAYVMYVSTCDFQLVYVHSVLNGCCERDSTDSGI